MNIHDYRLEQLIILAQHAASADVPEPLVAQLFNQLRSDLGLNTLVLLIAGPERVEKVLSNYCTRHGTTHPKPGELN